MGPACCTGLYGAVWGCGGHGGCGGLPGPQGLLPCTWALGFGGAGRGHAEG